MTFLVDRIHNPTRTFDEPLPKLITVFPAEVDVRKIRESLNLTQRDFSDRYGFQLATVQSWEQGRRKPEGPARLLLKIIEADPTFVDDFAAQIQ